jgi:hypothetical protein
MVTVCCEAKNCLMIAEFYHKGLNLYLCGNCARKLNPHLKNFESV